MIDNTLIIIFSDIISFGLGGLFVFWLFMNSERSRNQRIKFSFLKGISREDRPEEKKHNGEKQQTEESEEIHS
jgi:hypothetical protein